MCFNSHLLISGLLKSVLDLWRFTKSSMQSEPLIKFQYAKWGHIFSPQGEFFIHSNLTLTHVKGKVSENYARLLEVHQKCHAILALDQN